MNTEIDRKIAVIFVADVVGYCNIEEAKEIWERVEKTGLKLVQLKSYRKGTFFEKIKPHLGPLGLLQSLK